MSLAAVRCGCRGTAPPVSSARRVAARPLICWLRRFWGRRAKAFTAGTVRGAVAGGYGDDAARFYAAEAAKVIQAFFHAAALTGRTLDHVLRWVANPSIASEPTEILREHPHAAPYWHGLLQGALHGDDRTAGNTRSSRR
jgi:type IV secretion system protein VirD4